jgi:hypothetical protein
LSCKNVSQGNRQLRSFRVGNAIEPMMSHLPGSHDAGVTELGQMLGEC